MPKSKDAFRTISEVADWLDTPAHVLRFWESKFTQVKPVKRAGGRRYYRPEDMRLLGGIKKLLHDDGLTIKGAQKLLREHGVKHVCALSQPLDDEAIIEEAAYEADAQPMPEADSPATVLSFPSRAETPVQTTSETQAPVPASPAPSAPETPLEQPALETTAQTAPEAEPQPKADTQPQTAAEAETSEDNSPAFGKDALPAFLRRSPPAEPEKPAPKLAIDPVARFEPVTEETAATSQAEMASPEHDAPPQPQAETTPVFSHSETPPVVPDVPAEPAEPERPAALDIDVPNAAKVAPELESYTAEPGVLSALPGARGLSAALANEMSGKLADLRALRDRMLG